MLRSLDAFALASTRARPASTKLSSSPTLKITARTPDKEGKAASKKAPRRVEPAIVSVSGHKSHYEGGEVTRAVFMTQAGGQRGGVKGNAFQRFTDYPIKIF